MAHVTGIGGVFMRSKDPSALARWYTERLGVEAMAGDAGGVWWQDEGPTVWSAFPADTDYFGPSGQGWMINLRVDDLDAMRERLRADGAKVDERVETLDGIGRFGWVTDPEGNRIELWEPAPEALERG